MQRMILILFTALICMPTLSLAEPPSQPLKPEEMTYIKAGPERTKQRVLRRLVELKQVLGIEVNLLDEEAVKAGLDEKVLQTWAIRQFDQNFKDSGVIRMTKETKGQLESMTGFNTAQIEINVYTAFGSVAVTYHVEFLLYDYDCVPDMALHDKPKVIKLETTGFTTDRTRLDEKLRSIISTYMEEAAQDIRKAKGLK